MLTLDNKKIAIVGLGYVGLPLAVEFGKVRPVVGYDINTDRIRDLSQGIDKTLETNKSELQSSENLKFTTDVADIADASVYIVTVPTPIDGANRPDLTPLLKACEMVGKILSKNDVVIFESTVFPGCTEDVCVPILERESKLSFNQDFFCGYSPERINPGDNVNTLSKVVKVTSGSTDEIAKAIDGLYASIITAGTFLAPSIKVAEAAKVIENTQRDINIALINELSLIFHRLNIDTSDVLDASGSKWNFLPFRPGLVGGHCIGVDPYYLTHKAEEVGYQPQIILAGRRINDSMSHFVAHSLIKMMSKNEVHVARSRVAVLGATFKENCPDIRNSKVVDLVDELRDWGIEVVLADEWADPKDVESQFGLQLTQLQDVKDVDCVVVAVAHEEFKSLTPGQLRTMCRTEKPIVADLKSVYFRDELKEQGFDVFRL